LMAKHRSEAEQARWVARWRASGLGGVAFSRKHGFSASSLHRWAQRSERSAGQSAVGFAQVQVASTHATAEIEVELPNGCVVRVRGAVEESEVSLVLRAAAAC